MRQLIAGNWKMHLDSLRARELALAVAGAAQAAAADIVLCPPFVYLQSVRDVVRETPVALGAQNAHADDSGAFTGEVSAAMLRDIGCQFVILGHSERRQFFGETDSIVNRKLAAVIRHGMTAIVCLGESLGEREDGMTQVVVERQMRESLAGLSAADLAQLVLAYEPIWAIGTGKTATPEQAQEVHADLRNWLSMHYNPRLASAVRILYGGSVKPENSAALLSQPDIDGALVGGASLAAGDFLAIVAAAQIA